MLKPGRRPARSPDVRAVTFDLGDTLIRTSHGSVTGQLAECLEVDLPVLRRYLNETAKRVREPPGALAQDLCRQFSRPNARTAMQMVLEQEAAEAARTPDTYDDVAPTITRLVDAGLIVCGLSNLVGAVAPEPESTRDRLGLREVFYSCDLGFVKPEVAMFQYVESFLGLRSDQLLHIGDSEEADVIGACTSGWRALLLRRCKSATPQALPAPGCRGSISSLEAIVPMILGEVANDDG